MVFEGIAESQFHPSLWRHTPYSGLAESSSEDEDEQHDEGLEDSSDSDSEEAASVASAALARSLNSFVDTKERKEASEPKSAFLEGLCPTCSGKVSTQLQQLWTRTTNTKALPLAHAAPPTYVRSTRPLPMTLSRGPQQMSRLSQISKSQPPSLQRFSTWASPISKSNGSLSEPGVQLQPQAMVSPALRPSLEQPIRRPGSGTGIIFPRSRSSFPTPLSSRTKLSGNSTNRLAQGCGKCASANPAASAPMSDE